MSKNVSDKSKIGSAKKLFAGDASGSLLSGIGLRPVAMTYAEGMYHLFYVNNCKPGEAKCIYHAMSFDMINWQMLGKVINKPTFLHFWDAGSAIERNGKIELIYTRKGLGFSGVRLAASRNKQDYSEHPVPPISRFSLRRQKVPKNVVLHGFVHPRLFRAENEFYIIAAPAKSDENEFLMFSSPNLMNWKYKLSFMREKVSHLYRYAYPNVLRLAGRQFIVYSLVRDDGKDEIAGYRECALRLGDNCITPLGYFKKLPAVVAPCAVTIADGRSILLSTLKDGESNTVMALPKEVNIYGDILRVTPVQELFYLRRREDRFVVEDASQAEVRALNGPKEFILNIKAGTKLQVIFDCESAGHQTTLEISGTAIKMTGGSSTCFSEVPAEMDVLIRIIARQGAVEAFFDEGLAYLGMPTGGGKPTGITFASDEKTAVSVTAFDLELD